MKLIKDKNKLVEIFKKLSEIELNKGRYFPSRAFKTSADNIDRSNSYELDGSRVILNYDDEKIVLGQSSSDIFIEFINIGKSTRLDNEIGHTIKSSNLTEVSGIGEVKSQILINSGITSAEDLSKYNLKVGDCIPGTSLTYTGNIDTGLKFYLSTRNKRISREKAFEYLTDFKKFLIDNKVENFEMYPVGSYRRHKPTVGDIDIILVSSKDKIISSNVFEVVSKWFDSIFVYGDSKIAGVKELTQVDVRLIDRKYLGAHILHGTGSQEFNIKMRSYAKSLGLRLNEYGIIKDNELITFESEIDIFKYLKIPYRKPCDR